MKRIVLTLAALAFSTAALAEQNPGNWGDVLEDNVSQTSSYSSQDAGDIENHGSVLLDQVASNRGVDSEISIGSSDSLFDSDGESAF